LLEALQIEKVGNGGKRKHQEKIICALVPKNLMRIIRSHNWRAKLYEYNAEDKKNCAQNHNIYSRADVKNTLTNANV
jgi:hypothetical protein